MTEKRFTKCCPKIRDYGEEMSCTEVCDMLNHLNDENERLRSLFRELAELIEYDIENNIGVYPKTLLEYIINAIRKLGE